MKWSRRILSRWRRVLSLAALALLCLSALVVTCGRLRFAAARDRVYSVPPTGLVIPSDRGAIERGAHLAHSLGGCAECHGADLGGRVMADDLAMRLVAPNLTPGGSIRGYRDEDWARAILHGVARDGRSLLVMPSNDLGMMADSDIGAIVAYMKTLPAVDRALPGSEVGFLAGALAGLAGESLFAAQSIDHGGRLRLPAPPPPGPTRAYGEYQLALCRGCHGPDLRGGPPPHPGAPPASDISPPAMAAWRYEELRAALRDGRGRDGRALDPAMPWRSTRALRDDELHALWLALRGG